MPFTHLFTSALLASAFGLASAQESQLDIAAIAAAGPPPSPSIATNAPAQTVVYNAAGASQSAAAEQSAHPDSKRATPVKRAACDPQWAGKGPVPSPDTDQAFLSYSAFSDAANAAPTPAGYTNTFKNLKAMNNALGYVSPLTIKSLSTLTDINRWGILFSTHMTFSCVLRSAMQSMAALPSTLVSFVNGLR